MNPEKSPATSSAVNGRQQVSRNDVDSGPANVEKFGSVTTGGGPQLTQTESIISKTVENLHSFHSVE